MNPELEQNIRDHARRLLQRARAPRGRGAARVVQELNYEAMELLREYENIAPEVLELVDCLLDRSKVQSVLRRQKEIDERGYAEAITAEARDPNIAPFEPRNYSDTVEAWRKRPEWEDMLRRLRQYFLDERVRGK
jgi:hypothetical protein